MSRRRRYDEDYDGPAEVIEISGIDAPSLGFLALITGVLIVAFMTRKY